MSSTAGRRVYDADEVDAYTGPLEAQISVLKERLEANDTRHRTRTGDGVRIASAPFLGRAGHLAQRSAHETIRAARQEASEVMARANDEAQNRLADAQVRAAMLVSAAHGRIDSLAIGWEHQLVRQISDTGHGVLSGLDRYLEQLRSSPDDWRETDERPCSTRGEPEVSQGSSGEAPVARLTVAPLADTTARGTRPPDDAEEPAPARHPAPIAPAPRRRGIGILRVWKSFSLFRSKSLRGDRVTGGNDPFFNPDLRWKDDCPDEEFMRILRFGNENPPTERAVYPTQRARSQRRGQCDRSD